ncbi:MAG: NADH-quinone oxidoreductase subunit M [Armatimonadetes bacterium]|nr:NADH-quinone oxidoreductase subunit M [Armatimonadota bacterium]
MLTFLILLPLLGAALLLRRSEGEAEAIRTESALWTGLVALLTAAVYFGYQPEGDALKFAYEVNFVAVPTLGIHYHLGIDGISGLLLMLTGVLGFIAVLCSWTAVTDKVKAYHVCLLVLESALIGVFCSLDLFFFYVFFELVLVPMYFLIGLWGGERRLYAAIKFVLYTLVGSLLMLVAVLWLAYSGEPHTFDLIQLYGREIPVSAQRWAFAAMALAFAIKVPLFPLHTWLPDAHTEAPTAGSIILAGVLLKMGTYGFLRIAIPLFPQAAVAFQPLIVALAVVGILYGALVSLVQPDIKKLVAYSSVAHLGFVMLGLFTFTLAGMQGGMIQQINHGVSTGALFLLIGMIYERRHSRRLGDFGGLWTQMPVYSRLALIAVLASVGLPGLCGFVGEFFVLQGTAEKSMVLAAVAGVGVILAATYLLWMFQKAFYGEVTDSHVREMPDINKRELWCLMPLLVLMFWLGLQPARFMAPAEPAVAYVLKRVNDAEKAPLASAPVSPAATATR